MVLEYRAILYLERAKNELDLARAVFKLSTKDKLKLEFELKENTTFFSNVISNAYYCIFYSAKALLATKGIATKPPEEHRKALAEFEKLALSGEIDKNLLEIYKSIIIKADELLGIFIKEKSKRGRFTYRKLPQANLEPAKESLDNSEPGGTPLLKLGEERLRECESPIVKTPRTLVRGDSHNAEIFFKNINLMIRHSS